MTDSTNEDKNTTLSADLSTCFGVFIVVTIIYTMLKIIFAASTDRNWILGYILITIIIQWQLNSIIAKDNCNDTDQFTTAVLATLLPWIGIFCTINVLLLIFPGWKSPFSNTLGYLIAYMAGIKSAFVKMLKTPEAIDKSNVNDKALLTSIEHIYNDTSTIINEVNPENFEDAMTRLKPLMNDDAINDPSMKEDLFKYIITKDAIGEFVWLFLSGCMAINVGYVFIVNSNCVN